MEFASTETSGATTGWEKGREKANANCLRGLCDDCWLLIISVIDCRVARDGG